MTLCALARHLAICCCGERFVNSKLREEFDRRISQIVKLGNAISGAWLVPHCDVDNAKCGVNE